MKDKGIKIIDAEAELTALFSEHIAKSIDREILRYIGIEPDRNKRRKNSINKIFKFSV